MSDRAQNIRSLLASVIDETLPHAYGVRMGFCLLIFHFGGPGQADYVCNCDRADMIKALREAADRLEAGQDIPSTIGSA